jgi:hypothetical protein
MSRQIEPGPGRTLVLLLIACSVLFLGISLPLAWGMVEPNSWYGIRIPASRESEATWYEVNRLGGRIGIGIWAAYGLGLLWFVRRPPTSVLGQFGLTSSLAVVAVFWAVLVVVLVGR